MPEAVSPLTAINLFSGQPQHENFNRLHHIMPSSRLSASSTPHRFPAGKHIDLPTSFEVFGKQVDTEHFIDLTDTAALLVLHDGKVVHEQYRLTGGRDVQWISWSVAKSFTSALIGLAVAQGIPCITTLSGAAAAISAIEAKKRRTTQVIALQDLESSATTSA